jgi:hypothetical protein
VWAVVEAIAAHAAGPDMPSVKEAMAGSEAEKWTVAMAQVLESLAK